MNRVFRRVIVLTLVCLLIFSMLPLASAATVSSVKHTSNVYGQNVTIFYVNANNKNTTKVSVSCARGAFSTNIGAVNSYGFYEVLIYGRNSTGASWNYISKTNLKDVSSATLSMKGYTQYKVRVYSWNTATVANYAPRSSSPQWYWGAQPSCTFRAKSNVRSLAY